jgi:hypothetical protein
VYREPQPDNSASFSSMGSEGPMPGQAWTYERDQRARRPEAVATPRTAPRSQGNCASSRAMAWAVVSSQIESPATIIEFKQIEFLDITALMLAHSFVQKRSPDHAGTRPQLIHCLTIFATLPNKLDATRIQRPFHCCSWPPGVGLRPSRRPSRQGWNRTSRGQDRLLNLELTNCAARPLGVQLSRSQLALRCSVLPKRCLHARRYN